MTSDPRNASAEISVEDLYDSENPLVPGRTCGTCMLCCKVFVLAEFNKPAGTMCAHAVAGKGCTIRPQRPGVCRQFFCGWRLDPNVGPEWKPEISGFVLWISLSYSALMLTVDPATPLAWKREPYYSRLKVWAARAFVEDKRIVALVAGEATVVLPDRDVPLGVLAADDEIVLSRQGDGYDAERRKGPQTGAARD